MKNFIEKLWGPEDLTYKIYSWLTVIRKPVFYILLVFVLLNVFNHRFSLFSAQPDFLFTTLKAMISALLAVGAIIATFVTIALEIIRRQEKAEFITALWLKFAKYIIYPFAVAILFELFILSKEFGMDISETSLSLSLLLFFSYLTVNSVYIIVKAAEELVDEGWRVRKKDN